MQKMQLHALLVVSTLLLLSIAARFAVAASPAAAASAAASAAGERSVFGWWDVLQSGRASSLLSPRWWSEYILAEFRAEPAHVLVEVACFLTIAYLWLLRRPAPMQPEKLTKHEEEELIAEWKPAPLCPLLPDGFKTRFIVEGVTGRTITANGGQNYLNFASTNFLGLAGRQEITEACRATIDEYGVGSCGPRGFYGTFDVHLAVEAALAKFTGTDEAILYSDTIACISSVIPAFAKKGDIIVVDESCSFAIQTGCLLSRSAVYTFKHGNMDDLENVLAKLAEKEKASKRRGPAIHRKFIVLEGVSTIDGCVAPLTRVVELKNRFHYRLILDDSLGFGVLGEGGRGSPEHCGIDIKEVDAYCAAMDNALSSVGGFCAGSHQICDHQRLSGAGYCFSASSPPYTSTASIVALGLLAQSPHLCSGLRARAHKLRRALSAAHRSLVVLGTSDEQGLDQAAAANVSPVIHMALKGSVAGSLDKDAACAQLEKVYEALIDQHGIVTTIPEFVPTDKSIRIPTLRIFVTALHTEVDVDKLAKALQQVANKVL